MFHNSRKKFAWFFLLLMIAEGLLPMTARALTSGPAQPEMQKFEPAGIDNMVDLFTGDFKYDIPLLDVGGYPVSLSYHSGFGIEEDASWVGAGWSLNPGVINRDLRGFPDDFKGDKVIKEYNRKEFKKVGAQLLIKPSIIGWEIGSGALKVGVYKDNYYGIGAQVGAGLSWQLAKNKKTQLTAGLDLDSDTREGVNISPSLTIGQTEHAYSDENIRSLSGSFAYNSRSGLKQVELDLSFSNTKKGWPLPSLELSAVRYFGQTYTPSITNNTTNSGFTFSYDGGISLFGVYLGPGANGYVYREKILEPFTATPAYGYQNYLAARKSPAALLDFNREKDGVYIPGAPSIAIPVPTQDFFSATSQAGSLQFRPFYSGNYVVYDKAQSNTTTNFKAGVTIGGGNAYKIGARIDFTSGGSYTGKWSADNAYLQYGETEPDPDNPGAESVYYKQTGETSGADENFITTTGKEYTQSVAVNDKDYRSNKPRTYAAFKSREEGRKPIQQPIRKNDREKRTNIITQLTAEQAVLYGLDKTIAGEPRVNSFRKPHHVSEYTVTDISGKRMVYGIPVYNHIQKEVSFSANPNYGYDYGEAYYPAGDNSRANRNGRDNYFNADRMPPYATSYLLTAILSPDYIDLTNNGISEDDPGTAVKFNYTKLPNNFKWRAPYLQNFASYNKGYLTDPKDDKASYVYGEKETWYLESIENKTMVAKFYLSDREDGLGVMGEDGGKNTAMRLKKLDRIVLFSRAELTKNGANAVPVKTVNFNYDYSICPNVYNNTGVDFSVGNVVMPDWSQNNVNGKKGKLTLKRVYFSFGKNIRAYSHPFEFKYDDRLVSSLPGVPYVSGQTDDYGPKLKDRWGTYKQSWCNRYVNGSPKMNNAEFPYTPQPDTKLPYNVADLMGRFASKWQLNQISTPSGSIININYESDDYAHVQDRRAMQMLPVTSVGEGGSATSGLMRSAGITVRLPEVVASNDLLRKRYLRGADGQLLDKVYYKILTNFTKKGNFEYVQGYAEINPMDCKVVGDGTYAFIPWKKAQNDFSPVSWAAWQQLKSDLPHYAYDNYDNSGATNISDDFIAAIKSLAQSFTNLRELFAPFSAIASGKFVADRIDVDKSMIRLYQGSSRKLGGGARVKTVEMRDRWNQMSGNNGNEAVYGQEYKYTTLNEFNQEVSSGVAAYEPQLGNEENPFHEPINYTQKVHWSTDMNHFIERPFCESWFPGPTVGYSKVKVTAYGVDQQSPGTRVAETGHAEYEYFTAREFPTLVDNMPLEGMDYENSLILRLFTANAVKRLVRSQGFKVEVNDMHGKQKTVKIFNKAGDLVSASENFYNVVDENAERKVLNNRVDVLENNGEIKNRLLGTDIDFVTDVRQSVNESVGTSIGGYNGGMQLLFWYFPYFAINFNRNSTVDAFNSVSAVKVIHRTGLLRKTTTMQNGSVLATENLVWNRETGGVLLSRTQNDFDDYTYSFNYPAYLVQGQEGMRGAYENAGIIFPDLQTDNDGEILTSNALNHLRPGDQVVSLDKFRRGWIIRGQDNNLHMLDDKGSFMVTRGRHLLLRSGNSNQMDLNSGSIVSLKDPRVEINGIRQISFDNDAKVIEAKVLTYKDEWPVMVPDEYVSDPVLPLKSVSEIFPSCVGYFFRYMAAGRIPYQQYGYPREDARDYAFHGTPLLPGYISQYNNAMHQAPFNHSESCGSMSPDLPFYFNYPRSYRDHGIDRYYIYDGDTISIGSYQYVFEDVSNDLARMLQFQYDDYFIPSHGEVSSDCDCKYTVYATQNKEAFGAGVTPVPAPVKKLFTVRVLGARCDVITGLLAQPCPRNFCKSPLDGVINPYYRSIRGNWRPWENYIYSVNRTAAPGLPNQNGGTNIRQSGVYESFQPFWQFYYAGLNRTPAAAPSPASRWMWTHLGILYDLQGNEVETKDAMEVYSSSLTGYRNTSATAVSVNARRNEIAFDGFEDYDFNPQATAAGQCAPRRHLDFNLTKDAGNNWCSGNVCITNAQSHSGKYSLRLNGGTTVIKLPGNSAPPNPLLGFDSRGRVTLLANEQASGFGAIPGKRYVLSLWVKDGNPTSDKVSGLSISFNGFPQTLSDKIVPVVEEWKRLEVPFIGTGTNFVFQMTGNSQIYIDDIRIQPYSSKLSTFVYDDRTMRLMAKLDENNFATFYEYDDEGTLIRTKKETEKGVVTLQENRQHLKRQYQIGSN